jgi:hypothetical protein
LIEQKKDKLKKILVLLIILSFSNFVGCYYNEQMNPICYGFDEKINLTVTTTDTLYKLNENNYYLNKDTLFSTTGYSQIDRSTNHSQTLKIPVTQIEKVEVNRVDVLNTTLIVVGTAVVLILVIKLITFDGPNLNGLRFGP